MSDDSSSDGDYYGPALPPNFKKVEPSEVPRGPIIGPSLPPQMLELSDDGSKSAIPHKQEEPKPALVQIGPALPPGMSSNVNETNTNPEYDEASSDSDSEIIIGPLPPDHPKALSRHASSSDRPNRPTKPAKKLQREEWMLIAPRNKPVTELGLGPRKFLTRHPAEPVKEGEDVDSDEEFERNTRAAMDQQIIDAYDKTMEDMKDKVGGGKKRADSLLEIHQRELKKKKDEAPEEKERRPFDRDIDLSVTGLSGDDRKKYIAKSKEISSRFAQGRQKFL